MIDAAAIESTRPSPPITASQSQGVESRWRPSTSTCFGISGRACTARASAHSDARRILSRSIRAGDAKATANEAVAQISSNNSSRRSAVSRLESSMPLGIRLGSSTTAAATTGPASGPRPASSQPATGQMPRLISARSRRKLGGATAITPFGSLLETFPDLSRIMSGMVRKRSPPHNEKIDLCPMFTDARAPLFEFKTKYTAVCASGFRYIFQIPHSELLEGMNGRTVLRIRKAQQSPAVDPLEPERQLGLADLGGNAPAPSVRCEHKADLKILRSQHLCGKQAGKANNFGRGLLCQDGYTRQALTEGEKLPHHLAG